MKALGKDRTRLQVRLQDLASSAVLSEEAALKYARQSKSMRALSNFISNSNVSDEVSVEAYVNYLRKMNTAPLAWRNVVPSSFLKDNRRGRWRLSEEGLSQLIERCEEYALSSGTWHLNGIPGLTEKHLRMIESMEIRCFSKAANLPAGMRLNLAVSQDEEILREALRAFRPQPRSSRYQHNRHSGSPYFVSLVENRSLPTDAFIEYFTEHSDRVEDLLLVAGNIFNTRRGEDEDSLMRFLDFVESTPEGDAILNRVRRNYLSYVNVHHKKLLVRFVAGMESFGFTEQKVLEALAIEYPIFCLVLEFGEKTKERTVRSFSEGMLAVSARQYMKAVEGVNIDALPDDYAVRLARTCFKLTEEAFLKMSNLT